jgi:hypothetical protein
MDCVLFLSTDSQLRRNKTPLATRASWRYIAVKKGYVINFTSRIDFLSDTSDMYDAQ